MDYLKHYIKLVRKAQNRTIEGYFERHHVFPQSIFGKNKFIVKLSAREHYIAHALLEKIYIHRYGKNNVKTRKMIHAFFIMNNAKGIGQKRYVNSRLFEASKLRFKERMSGENSPMYGKKRIFSEAHIENIRKSRKKGKDHPLYGIPRSDEVKEKIKKPKQQGHGSAVSAARKGMKFSKEHRKNLSLSHLGNQPSTKGKSRFRYDLITPDGENLTLNGIELRDYAKENNLNLKGLVICARSTGVFKNYKITETKKGLNDV
jgi:hypothetical protein